ncbi:MAG TPA: hypothetical protein PKY59_01020 [Pyrinomonadaceae bacterium]|nr:hypothetical protein [Pyrinomonadaceae bacterium]
MIEIELTEPKKTTCECCGGTSTMLTRFVYKDGDAFAAYKLVFSDNHPENAVIGVISLGDWGSEGVPPNRVAFPFRLWANDENFNVGLMNANESPYNKIEILGKMLDREEALSHPWIEDVFHITDHITAEDTEVINFFKLNSSAIN